MRDTFTKYAKDYYYETFGRPSDKTQDKDLDIRSGLVSFGEFIDLKSVTIVDTCHIHAFIRDNPQLNINFFRDCMPALIKFIDYANKRHSKEYKPIIPVY
ncbi:MAG: hypothetical protein MR659_06225 [Mollicutes bacterium]|jgi:hypothetical protein|nr:hypothetical protein [Mollicutes bacterium]